jgi:hypothetical protein
MSVPEFFHHQDRFVGALGIRRQRRLQAGARVGKTVLTGGDAAAYAVLAEGLFIRWPGEPRMW